MFDVQDRDYDQVEVAMFYALRACKDGPVKRHEVTSAMRNQEKWARHEAAKRLIDSELVSASLAPSTGKGRTPVILAATEFGRMEYERLESKYMEMQNTIWR